MSSEQQRFGHVIERGSQNVLPSVASSGALSLGASNNHALWLVERKIQAKQEFRNRLRLHLQTFREKTKGFVRGVGKVLPLAYLSKLQHYAGGDRVARGLRSVVVVFHPQDQIARAGRALKEAALFGIVKKGENPFSEQKRKTQGFRVESGLVQINASGSEVPIRLKKLHVVPLGVAPTARESFSLRVPKVDA